MIGQSKQRRARFNAAVVQRPNDGGSSVIAALVILSQSVAITNCCHCRSAAVADRVVVACVNLCRGKIRKHVRSASWSSLLPTQGSRLFVGYTPSRAFSSRVATWDVSTKCVRTPPTNFEVLSFRRSVLGGLVAVLARELCYSCVIHSFSHPSMSQSVDEPRRPTARTPRQPARRKVLFFAVHARTLAYSPAHTLVYLRSLSRSLL